MSDAVLRVRNTEMKKTPRGDVDVCAREAWRPQDHLDDSHGEGFERHRTQPIQKRK